VTLDTPSAGLAGAERRILARAYGEAAELLDEFGWIAVDAGLQDDYDAALRVLIFFGRRRSHELDPALPAPLDAAPPAPRDALAAWSRLLDELEGNGELLSPVNVGVHGSIGYWGLALLADFVRMKRAEFDPN
jgi:hypothetical protein